MLPFGSFLTNIPLFILAFAYMLYFSVHALNKINVNEDADLPAVEEKYVKSTSVQTDSNILYYHKAFIGKQVACSKAGVEYRFKEPDNTLPHYIPDRKFSFLFCGDNLFSRPPPYLG